MKAIIRPFSDEYLAMIELWNSLNPDWPRTVADLQDSDAKREARYKQERFVAEVDGRFVGVGEYYQNPGMYHPQKFILEGYVHPDFQGQGIGKALYERVMQALQPFDPVSVRATVRENQTRALRFLQERGLVETKRDWVSTLQVAKASLEPYLGLEEQLKTEGIRILSFAQLLQQDPQARQKLHQLFSDIRLDTPRSEPATPISFGFFEKDILSGPDYDPAAFFIALDGEDWIGMSAMFRVGDSQSLDHWFTGTRRAYRGRRIALALKVRTIQYAQAHGFQTIRTDNDSMNAPMLAINDKLGFVRGAAQISMRKIIREDRGK